MRPDRARSSSPYESTRLRPSFDKNVHTEYDPRTHTSSPGPERSFIKGPKGPRRSPYTDTAIVRTRIILRILSILVSSSILGVITHTYGNFLWVKRFLVNQHQGEGMSWVGKFKVTPSIVLISFAAIATGLSLILLLASCAKSVRHATTTGNLTTAVVAGINFGMWTTVKMFYEINRRKDKQHLDLMSFVCNKASTRQSTESVCTEYIYAWAAVLASAIIELLVLGTVVWGVVVARKKAVYSKI
ncbi:hypothetical protein P154DRAFT_562973 [Amniculicola lignicola CBS 123094]|uniref:MARVEL domain-containing protein n=1 Tax=Amniculicola lignicola CBS 123094 TaxID=1392246 RepID=A0A6A5WJB7_9PLEO|nr:hypothetical protein P154DRAFT_562973 [Amniculicola lignicola CBS 123094]